MPAKKKLLIGIGILILFLLIGAGVARFAHLTIADVTVPFFRAGTDVASSAKNLPLSFQSKSELIQEVERLQSEKQALEAALISREALVQENRELREAGGMISTGSWKTSTVLSRPPQSPYDTFRIDAGAAAGIKAGFPVYAYGEVLIGEIVSVSQRSALVQLYSAPQVETLARIRTTDEEEISVTVIGQGGGSFSLTVPREVPIEQGALITREDSISSVLGMVRTITVDDQDPFQVVRFSSPVNIQTLNYVQVRIPAED